MRLNRQQLQVLLIDQIKDADPTTLEIVGGELLGCNISLNEEATEEEFVSSEELEIGDQDDLVRYLTWLVHCAK